MRQKPKILSSVFVKGISCQGKGPSSSVNDNFDVILNSLS